MYGLLRVEDLRPFDVTRPEAFDNPFAAALDISVQSVAREDLPFFLRLAADAENSTPACPSGF